MADTRPGDGLSVKQLLYILRERIASIHQNKPPDLILDEARAYEQEIGDVLVRARCLINSFHIVIRTPPEILCMISSYLTEEDLFSASQACHHWRSVPISFPSLWARVSCRHVPRTTTSLERCRSLPIQLRLEPPFSTAALADVLLHGNEIASLTINHNLRQIPQLYQLFKLCRSSVEQLHIYSEVVEGGVEQRLIHGLWRDLPSLRKLLICRCPTPIGQLNAPSLVHLTLDHTGYIQAVTVRTVLGMLRGCPLLETLLLSNSNILHRDTTRDHSSVCLPHLRSIELDVHEVHSGLITYLRFPSNVAVGFREMCLDDVCDNIPLVVMVAMQHVLRRIDIRCITLAAPPHSKEYAQLLIRFEGLQGSLEITTGVAHIRTELPHVLFGPEGVLFSHSPRIENVRELHIVGCSFDGGGGLEHVNAAMSNLVSISFFHCSGFSPFELLIPTNRSSPPFPHLERVMVLGPESGLERMVRERRDCGVPLKTLVVGRRPRGFECDYMWDWTALEEFVDDLQIGCATEILDWGAGNEILNVWSTTKLPCPHILTGPYETFKFCRFNISGGCKTSQVTAYHKHRLVGRRGED